MNQDGFLVFKFGNKMSIDGEDITIIVIAVCITVILIFGIHKCGPEVKKEFLGKKNQQCQLERQDRE